MLTKNANAVFQTLLGRNFPGLQTNIVGTGGTNVKNMAYKDSISSGINFIPYFMTRLANPAYLGEHTGSYTVDVHQTSGVAFGNGTTEPTADDLTLSGDFIHGLVANSNVIITSEMNVDDTGCTYTTLYTITNSTDADITISEMGIFSNFYGSTGSYSTIKTQVIPYMIERTLLETPVTIPVNGVGQVTYTFRIDSPIV